MLAELFKGLFDTDITSVISLSDFLVCIGSALAIGLILAAFYMYRSRYTKASLLRLRCFRRWCVSLL